MKPLEGVRILSFCQYGAGPYATLQLADLGAEVIKIEDLHSGGDVSRAVIPYADNGDSLYFQALNRNKKSVALNLRTEEGQGLFRALAAKSQAVFNNLRGDVPRKLGLTYEALKSVNPKIVTCSLSGFGTTGSKQAEPAYDYLLQAMLGHMSLTGDPEGPPEKYGLSMIDFSTGLMAAFALMTGIYQAERTGEGCDLDVSLFDTAASMLNYLAIWNLNRGYQPAKTRHSAHPSLVPSQLFSTRDGHIMIMCNKEKFFPALCGLLGVEALASDSRYLDFASRLQHKESLIAELSPVFEKETSQYWVEKLSGTIPVARVNTVAEAMQLPLMLEREMIVEMEHPTMGLLKMMGTPVKVSGFRPHYTAGPVLGGDTDQILKELLGLEQSRVKELRASGVIG